jgi:hypothetical protein
MVHSLIGLFCGVFGNGPEYRQLTHGIFDDIFRDLGPAGDLHFQPGHTKTVYYNEVALGRWLERTVRSLGVRTILGTALQRAVLRDGRITEIELASRYGNVTIAAHGFVDASGDAALTWQAGAPRTPWTSRAGAACTTSTWTGCAAGRPPTCPEMSRAGHDPHRRGEADAGRRRGRRHRRRDGSAHHPSWPSASATWMRSPGGPGVPSSRPAAPAP